MLWQKWVQVLFLTPSLLAPFPPDLVAGNWRGEFWRKWRDSSPLKVWPGAVSLYTPSTRHSPAWSSCPHPSHSSCQAGTGAWSPVPG